MGAKHCQQRLQDRVLFESSSKGPYESHSGSNRPSETHVVGRRNPWPCNQESHPHRSPRKLTDFVQIEFLPGSQKTQPLETHSQLKTTQQEIHKTEEVPDGDPSHNHPDSNPGHVGYIDRFKGRLSSHPHPPRLSTLPSLPLQTRRLRVRSPPFRSGNCSQSLHSGNKIRPRLPSSSRNYFIRLLRRLANSRSFRSRMQSLNLLCDPSAPRSRLGYKPREVQSSAFTERRLSGSSSGFLPGCSKSDSGKDSLSLSDSHTTPFDTQPSSSSLAPPPGTSSQSSRNPSLLQTPDETNPVLLTSSFQTQPTSSVFTSQCFRRGETVSSMVDRAIQPVQGETVRRLQTDGDNHNGCLQFRLGRNPGNILDGRPLVPSREAPTYQCSRTDSSQEGNSLLGQRPQRLHSRDFFRQFNHSSLPQPSGGYQVPPSMPGNLGSPSLLPVSQHYSQGDSSCREPEHPCRRPLQGPVQPPRMVPQPEVGGLLIPDFWSSSHRSLCQPPQQQIDDFLFQTPSPQSLGFRCSVSQLGRPLDVRLSATSAAPESSTQAPSVQGHDDPGSSVLAETAVVSSDSPDVGRPPTQTSTGPLPPITEGRTNSSPRPSVSRPSCLEVVHGRLHSEGLSRRAIDFAANARRGSTIKTYDSRLEKYYAWARSNTINPLEASVDQLGSFFISLFDEGKQISTIRNYRSAIASIHQGFPDGSSLGSNESIRQILRGMFNRRPPRRRLAPSWSINDVLQSLTRPPYEPIHNAPLDALTRKTLFLIAAASARRRSEIHALSVKPGFIRFAQSGVSLLPDPDFLAKNQTETFTPTPIFLPTMSSASATREDRFYCPVRALKWYIEKTKSLRTSDALFILPRSPYNQASKDTISKWLVRTISPFVTPEDSVRAHDIRSHATSAAWFQGVPIQDILNAAAWKTPSTFVSCYLTNVVSPEANFARTVLRGSNPSVQDLPPASRC